MLMRECCAVVERVMTGNGLDGRLEFMQVTAETRRTLRSAQPLISEKLPGALDHFYAQVRATPETFHRLFPATGGALYGRTVHGWQASFQRPKAATRTTLVSSKP